MWDLSQTSVTLDNPRYFWDGSFEDVLIIPFNAERIIVPGYLRRAGGALSPIETRQKFVSDKKDFCLSFYRALRFYWLSEQPVTIGSYAGGGPPPSSPTLLLKNIAPLAQRVLLASSR